MRIERLGRVAPALGLAAEREALARVERDGADGETLLLWEADSVAAVLPRSGDEEAFLLDPHLPGAPVLRRHSGGGAVLVGPGCLNYAFALSLEARPALTDVSWSYEDILGRVARALAVPDARAEGSDLALGDRKFGGHAQRRTRLALLHHGTILHAFDLALVGQLLREPERRPAYRGARTHEEFLTNLPLSPDAISAALISAAHALSSTRA
ncbi:MAG: lipoate--protein ligase family protein [Bryobacterales bacterium]|nr:lipoate--protein ligase family protein [Bryobacterales bacterium]